MLLLRPAADETPQRGAIVLLGVGLIGAAVRDELRRRGWRGEARPLAWTPGEDQTAQLAALAGELGAVAADAGPIRFLWAAGRAGFASPPEETAAELASFAAALACAESLARDAAAPVAFHAISSIGGLFEGQRHVDERSRPEPRRPYGRLKLDQETALLAAEPRLARRVYRLTSVYGAPRGGQRRGLVPTLLANGRLGRTTAIVGRLDTLRDFVWVADVARFLARALTAATPVAGPVHATLASAKPSSILEVAHRVEAVLGRRLVLSFDAEASNSLDVTVSPTLLPPGFTATDPLIAFRSVYEELAG